MNSSHCISNTCAITGLAAHLVRSTLQPVLKCLHDASGASLLEGPVAVGDVCAANVLKLLPRMLAEGKKRCGLHSVSGTGLDVGELVQF